MKNNYIDYIEFKAHDLINIKSFYSNVFGWKFTDYGPDYVSFENSGVFGGFEKTEEPIAQGVLIVLYHENLAEMIRKVVSYGGKITKDMFNFPGGRRFQFSDPSGNELAVWSE